MIELNDDQKTASRKIKRFLSSDKKEFCLSGRAGVGKTTMIREVFTRKGKVSRNVKGTTISHKARLVLQQSIPKTQTIASLLQYQLILNEYGQIQFVPKKNAMQKPYNGRALIVDEASMISQSVRENILESVSPKTKIIYLGDQHQLPPISIGSNKQVGESPVFKLYGYELKTLVRQVEGEPLADMLSRMCQAITINEPINFLATIRGRFNKETATGWGRTNEEKAINSYVGLYKEMKEQVRFTAYRNKTVDHINETIRKRIINSDNPFEPGDLLTANDQYMLPDDTVVFYNGEDLWVESVREGVVDFMGDTYKVYFLDVGKNFDVPILKQESKGLYFTKQREYKSLALKDNSQWPLFFEFIRLFANVSYGYCLTNYKIQGATFHTVYSSLSDILSVKPLDNLTKLKAAYVAFSRPTNQLGIF